VPEGLAVEGFSYKITSNVFVFLGHFHMDCLNELVLGLCSGAGQASSGIGGGGWGLGVLGAIPDILPLKA